MTPVGRQTGWSEAVLQSTTQTLQLVIVNYLPCTCYWTQGLPTGPTEPSYFYTGWRLSQCWSEVMQQSIYSRRWTGCCLAIGNKTLLMPILWIVPYLLIFPTNQWPWRARPRSQYHLVGGGGRDRWCFQVTFFTRKYVHTSVSKLRRKQLPQVTNFTVLSADCTHFWLNYGGNWIWEISCGVWWHSSSGHLTGDLDILEICFVPPPCPSLLLHQHPVSFSILLPAYTCCPATVSTRQKWWWQWRH